MRIFKHDCQTVILKALNEDVLVSILIFAKLSGEKW